MSISLGKTQAKGRRGKSIDASTADWLILHCLGFGACWGWVHVAFFSTVLWGDSGEMLSLSAWLVNVFTNGCAMVALGFLSLRLAPLTQRRWLVATLVVLTVGGTFGLSAGQSEGNAWVYAGSIVSGVGTAGLLLLWAEAYRSIAPVIAKKYTIPWSMVLGVLYYLVIGMLPTLAAVAVTAMLPILSVGLLIQSNRLRRDGGFEEGAAVEGEGQGEQGRQCEKAEPAPETAGTRRGAAKLSGRFTWRGTLPLKFAACAAVYCLPAGFMRGYPSALSFVSAGGIGEAVFAGAALVMVLVAVASILLVKQQQLDMAYKMIVPLMAAGLLLLPFVAPGQEAIAGICIMSGYILFEVYVWATLSDIAANVSAPSALVFGVGKSGMNVGLLAGTFVGIWLGSSSSMLLVAISILIVYLFIVVDNVVSPRGGVVLPLPVPARTADEHEAPSNERKLGIAEAAQMDLAEAFSAILRQRCEIISTRFGLSSREAEVLELLAKGHSLQAIADSLGVAYSTVKTHTDRIYSKTDVHSRQELIALLEESDEQS